MHEQGVELDEHINGTGPQSAAAEFLVKYRRSQGFVDCMHQRGYPDEAWTFYNTKVNWRPLTVFDSGIGWLTPLDSHWVSDSAIRLAPAQIAVDTDHDGPFDDNSPQYLGARRECWRERAPLPTGLDVDQYGRPRVAEDAWSDFFVAQNDLMDDLTDRYRDQYADCMHDHGYPDVFLPYETLTNLMAEEPAPNDRPIGDGPATAEWSTFLEKEDAALAADTACRSDIYAEGMAAAGPILTDFVTTHADDLEASAASWQVVLEAAEQLGFDPTKTEQRFS